LVSWPTPDIISNAGGVVLAVVLLWRNLKSPMAGGVIVVRAKLLSFVRAAVVGEPAVQAAAVCELSWFEYGGAEPKEVVAAATGSLL
jgi:hypothetical protein